MLFAQAWQTDQPLQFFVSNGLSSMSTSVPGAIALAHAKPDVPVVSVSGDGGFAMMVQELETVNRLGISPLFVVLVDQALSLIRIPQQMRGLPSRGIDLAPVDWAMVAKGFGVTGVWANTETELTEVLEDWLANRKAMVIAVRVDERLYKGNSY
jgi:acetolactate synthase-1/2/3 large subunit